MSVTVIHKPELFPKGFPAGNAKPFAFFSSNGVLLMVLNRRADGSGVYCYDFAGQREVVVDHDKEVFPVDVTIGWAAQ